MNERPADPATAADRAMRARRFAEAIDLLERRLETHPDDLAALLKLGICRLLTRSERAFVAIHASAQEAVRRAGELPADVARLWAQYTDLARKLAATALVVGSAALPSCTTSPDKTDASTAPAAQQEEPLSAHKYSGGVFKPMLEPVEPADAAPATDLDASKPAKQDDVQSSHRYSGGVFLPRDGE